MQPSKRKVLYTGGLNRCRPSYLGRIYGIRFQFLRREVQFMFFFLHINYNICFNYTEENLKKYSRVAEHEKKN